MLARQGTPHATALSALASPYRWDRVGGTHAITRLLPCAYADALTTHTGVPATTQPRTCHNRAMHLAPDTAPPLLNHLQVAVSFQGMPPSNASSLLDLLHAACAWDDALPSNCTSSQAASGSNSTLALLSQPQVGLAFQPLPDVISTYACLACMFGATLGCNPFWNACAHSKPHTFHAASQLTQPCTLNTNSQINLTVAVAVAVNGSATERVATERALLAWTSSLDVQVFLDSLDLALVSTKGMVISSSVAYTLDDALLANGSIAAASGDAAAAGGGVNLIVAPTGQTSAAAQAEVAAPMQEASSLLVGRNALAGLLVACVVTLAGMGIAVAMMRRRHHLYRLDVEKSGVTLPGAGGKHAGSAGCGTAPTAPSSSGTDSEVRWQPYTAWPGDTVIAVMPASSQQICHQQALGASTHISGLPRRIPPARRPWSTTPRLVVVGRHATDSTRTQPAAHVVAARPSYPPPLPPRLKFLLQQQQARALVCELQSSGFSVDISEPTFVAHGVCSRSAHHSDQRRGPRPGSAAAISGGASGAASGEPAAGGGSQQQDGPLPPWPARAVELRRRSPLQPEAVALPRGDSVMSAADLELAAWERRGSSAGDRTPARTSVSLGGGPMMPAGAAAGAPAGAESGDAGEVTSPDDGPGAHGGGWRRSPRAVSTGGWSGVSELCGPASGAPGSCAGIHLSPACSPRAAAGADGCDSTPGSRVMVCGGFSAAGLRQRLSAAGADPDLGPCQPAVNQLPSHAPTGAASPGTPLAVPGVGSVPSAAAADAGDHAGAGADNGAAVPRGERGRSPFLQYNLMALES